MSRKQKKPNPAIHIYPWMIALRLKGAELLIYAIVYTAEEYDQGFPRLAQTIGMTQAGTIRAISRMIKSGYIEKTRQGSSCKKCNCFKVIVPAGIQAHYSSWDEVWRDIEL